jgi:hypothetical protein
MVSSGANVIIWCYHVILSSGMITSPFLFFLKTSHTRGEGRAKNLARGQALCTDKKENQIFLIYKEIQKGSVDKSYLTNGLLIFC